LPRLITRGEFEANSGRPSVRIPLEVFFFWRETCRAQMNKTCFDIWVLHMVQCYIPNSSEYNDTNYL
jgi:hypothetical protein